MRSPGMNSALSCSLKLRLTHTFTRFLSKFIPPRPLPFGVFAALIIEIKKIYGITTIVIFSFYSIGMFFIL